MSTFGFSRLFSNNSNRNVHRNRSGSKGKRGRIARIEELEGREMLSVSPWAFYVLHDHLYQEEYADTVVEPSPTAAIAPASAISPFNDAVFNSANFQTPSVGADYIELSWNTDPGYHPEKQTYRLEYREFGNTQWTEIIDRDHDDWWWDLGGYWQENWWGSGGYAYIEGLNADTRYEFRLTLRTEEGGLNEIIIQRTTRASLDAPTNFTVGQVTAGTVTLNWSAVTGANWYGIEYRVKGEDEWQYFDVGEDRLMQTSSTSYVVRGLNPNTEYEFHVVASAVVHPGERQFGGGFNYYGGLHTSTIISATTQALFDKNAADVAAITAAGLNEDRDDIIWDNVGTQARVTGLRIDISFSESARVLDLTAFTELQTLYVNGPLDSLNLVGLTNLVSIDLSYNRFTSLNLSGLTGLEQLNLYDDYSGDYPPALTSLNLSGCTALKYLNIYADNLTSLDLTGVTNLVTLDIYEHSLTSLNLSGMTKLKGVSIDGDATLHSLDVSGCTALQELVVVYNQLTSLNLTGAVNLEVLAIADNQLTALDIASLTRLHTLHIGDNNFTFSTLPPRAAQWIYYEYAYQGEMPLMVAAGGTIDLSQEYSITIDGVTHTTQYTWYHWNYDAPYASEPVHPSHIQNNNGVFSFQGLPVGSQIYCVMTNGHFPELSLGTTHVAIGLPTTVALTGITVNTNAPQVGDTITATLTPSGATATYQWFRGTESAGYGAIAGATSSSYTVTANDAGFILRVVATGTGEYTGMVSHTLTNAVPPVETPPDEVDIISATGGANSLTIAWTEALTVEGDFQYRQGNSQWMTWQGTYIGNSITIVGLRAGQYEVRLVDAQGNVSYHENNINVTSSNVHIPNALKPRVRVERAATTINSITLNWTDPVRATAESNARYVVTYSIREGRSWLPVEQFTTTENRYTFTGLNPNTSYRFNVTAVNTQGEEGRNSRGTITSGVNVTAKTTNYTAVRAKATVLRGSSDASISLTPPNVNRPDRWPMGIRGNAHYATYYEVAIYNNTVSARNIPSSVPIALDMITINDETTGIIAGNATSFYISGLTLGQRYTVVIHAVTVDADGIETKSAMTRVLLNIRA